MKKFVIILSKPALILCLAFGSLNIYAQQASEKPSAAQEERVSNADLIKLATKAPLPENFSTEEEYAAAKEAWIKEYPDAHKRIVGPKSQFAVAANGATEEQQIAAKQAWIAAHPEEYARMLGEGAVSAPAIQGE